MMMVNCGLLDADVSESRRVPDRLRSRVCLALRRGGHLLATREISFALVLAVVSQKCIKYCVWHSFAIAVHGLTRDQPEKTERQRSRSGEEASPEGKRDHTGVAW